MGKLTDEITETVARLVLYKDRCANGVSCAKELSADDWAELYSGVGLHALMPNKFRAEVDYAVSSIVQSIYNSQK